MATVTAMKIPIFEAGKLRIAAIAIAVLSASAVPGNANDVCRRNPNPICVSDWAAELAGAGGPPLFLRRAIRVRLRMDDVSGARSLLERLNPGHIGFDPSLAEIIARTGNRIEARSAFARTSEHYHAVAKSGASGIVGFEELRTLSDSQRRAGFPAEAIVTLRRAVEALRVTDVGVSAVRRAAARATEFTRLGNALRRMGDLDGARRSLVLAEHEAPLGEIILGRSFDADLRFAANLSAYAEIAQLTAALDDSILLTQRLARIADHTRGAIRSDTITHNHRLVLVAVLVETASAQANLGKRDAALATAEHAIDALTLLEGPRGDNEEILLNAYIAIANWSEALRVLRRPSNNREVGLRAVALAQARSGNLAAAVGTIMLMPDQLWMVILSEAALAATEDR